MSFLLLNAPMPHFKRKQRAVAEIHLSLHDEDGEGLPTPTNQSHYLSHETIQGCVLLRLPPGVETARCQITLKGMLTEFSARRMLESTLIL